MLLHMPASGATPKPTWLITLPQIFTGIQTQVYGGLRPTRRHEALTKETLEEAVELLIE